MEKWVLKENLKSKRLFTKKFSFYDYFDQSLHRQMMRE